MWLFEPLTCQISPLHAVSALSWFLSGGDSDYAYAPAANKCSQHTPLILLRGGSRQPVWKPTSPYSAGKALTMISGWPRGWSGESKWVSGPYEQRGELIRRLCPQGGTRCPQSWGTTAETDHGLNFWTHQRDFEEEIGSARPRNDDKKSLFTVAIETRTGSL